MDFLVHKFSDWLKNNHVDHTCTRVKGGYIINFINPDENLKKLISSLFILIETGQEKNGIAERKPLNIFTATGDGIVLEEGYIAQILSTVQPAIYEYIANKKF